MNPEESTLVPNEPTPEGEELGARMAAMTDREVAKLIEQGEWEKDLRCQSCAFRGGTVPNQCPVTLMDALKCVLEGGDGETFFSCHCPRKNDSGVCMGWFAARQSFSGKIKVPWEFSPQEEPQTENT